jgi:hypothetical protein
MTSDADRGDAADASAPAAAPQQPPPTSSQQPERQPGRPGELDYQLEQRQDAQQQQQ